MKIEELKNLIEQNNYRGEPFIFNEVNNCDFIVHQYINDLVLRNNFQLVNVDSIKKIPFNTNNFLSFSDDNYFYLYTTYSEEELRNIVNFKNCCIIYIGKKLKNVLDIEEYIINIPKIENWQIKDYVYSRGAGVDRKDLDYLLELTNSDLWRLEKELDKIEIFDKSYRKEIFKQFINNGIFNDLTTYNTFSFTDAVIKRQKTKVFEIYQKLQEMGTNYMGVIALLYNNFRNIIKIQLSPNPSPENTGLKPNQFYAIKKNSIGYYNKDELLHIFDLLTKIDKQIKTGEIEVDKSIEYLLVNIL